MVTPCRRADMYAASEARAKHKDAAFAGRAAKGHCRRKTAVTLCTANFRNLLEHCSTFHAGERGPMHAIGLTEMEAINHRRKRRRATRRKK
jgi:hypothetical protein